VISSLVALISLTLTTNLVASGVVAETITITGATTATPSVITVAPTKVQPVRPIHAVVSGVGGMPELSGTWVLTPIDATHFSLSSLSAQGIAAPVAGTGTYTTGGAAQIAFPEGSILFGRRNVALSTAASSPRIVFVPTRGKAWDLDPYGGAGSPATVPNSRGTLEQQAQKLEPQLATEFITFEVYVSATGPNYGNVLAPDSADFDATQAIAHALYAVLFDGVGGARGLVLGEDWPSQRKDAGTQSQRGQQWLGIIQIEMPVNRAPLAFVPVGTYLIETVTPVGGTSGDTTTITVT
jgi:hypothetical protein